MAVLFQLDSVCVLLFLQLLIFSKPIKAYEEMQYMNHSSTENFTIDCDSLVNSSLCESLTLSQIAENPINDTHIYIDISIPQLQLSGKVEFKHQNSVAISGSGTIISCSERNSGLVFVNVKEVIVVNITLTNCGHSDRNYLYAIRLLCCRDINFINFFATNNSGTAVSILHHQGGIVNFSNCTFINNSIASDKGSMRGGGGVYIDFDHHPPVPSTYYFTKCSFAGNIARTRFYHFVYTNEMGESISGYGRGGGVFLAFQKTPLTNIDVVFSDCNFSKNKGFFGGGLSIEIQGGKKERVGNITVTVKNSLFEGNGCARTEDQTGQGGGMHLNFNTHNKQKLSHCKFHLINVNFCQNCAAIGGGVYFFSDYRESRMELNSLIFENCTFIKNMAYIGSAFALIPNIYDRLAKGFLLVPTLVHCQFLSNVHIQSKTAFSTGTLYSSQYTMNFVGYTKFYNNSGTALYIVNGVANFSDGDAIFLSNMGIKGGALALIGLSSLLVGGKCSYSFINNTAMDRGGAIYVLMVDRLDYTVSSSCFIQYHSNSLPTSNYPISEWKSVNIIFSGNLANSDRGHAIFATSLYPCQVYNDGTINKSCHAVTNVSEVFSIRNIKFDDNLKPQVATEGESLHHNGDLPLQIIPGEHYNHTVILSDELGNSVETTLQASVKTSCCSNVELSSEFSSCLSDEISLKGDPNESAQLSLQTVSLRQTFIELEIKLLSCPPGFSLEQKRCACHAHLYTGFLRCDTNGFYSYLHSGFWTGLVRDNISDRIELVTGFCPAGFCDYNGSKVSVLGIKLPQNASLLDEAICGKSRTGVLCGECKKGYTTHFHSPNFLCKPVDPALCRVGWLFYILSELVPVTVVFITVLVLNISFTSGAVNGFVLFSQLINSLKINIGALTFSTSEKDMVTVYQVLYGLFNLDYFNTETLSFCLWNGASALDMIAFKYITITYALVLVAMIIWFMNKCGGRCLGKWYRITKLKSSVIHGITTFLVICYAQCINVSLILLIHDQYTAKAGSDFATPEIVQLNGNLVYFRGKHLLYALPALFCLVTIGILPPIFLLSYPLFNKILSLFGLEGTKGIRFISQMLSISSLKPLFDSFQSCFKDNLRFFAGLYFLYRWIGLVVNASVSNHIIYYTTVEILFLCVLAVHAICQPYIRRAHNIVDTLLFTDLAIINAISIVNYHRNQNHVVNLAFINIISFVIQLILIYLPLCAMMVYILIQMCKHRMLCVSCNEAFSRNNIPLSKTFKLRLLMHFNGRSTDECESNDDDELPYRLAADADYASFDDHSETGTANIT